MRVGIGCPQIYILLSIDFTDEVKRMGYRARLSHEADEIRTISTRI